MAGDEVVVTKAGTPTFGRDRFFSSVRQKASPGVAVFSLALIRTKTRHAVPVRLDQVVRTADENAAANAKAAPNKRKLPGPKRKPGRPKGSKTKPQAEVILSPDLQRIRTMLHVQLQLIAGMIPLVSLAMDGHVGNSLTRQMAREGDLHLSSTLRADAALYVPYAGPYQGRGPRRKYGTKLDVDAMPVPYLRRTTVVDGVETCIYQAEVLRQEFPQPLNVVVIGKTKLFSTRRPSVAW